MKINLFMNSKLHAVAQEHSMFMSAAKTISHTGIGGQSAASRIGEILAGVSGFAENVAQGQQSQSVPPPENFNELMSQKFAPIQNKVGAIAPAMDQLSQGNVMKAVNTIRQPSNPNVQSGMTQPAPMVGYDYTHGLD